MTDVDLVAQDVSKDNLANVRCLVSLTRLEDGFKVTDLGNILLPLGGGKTRVCSVWFKTSVVER